jgi:hypothetical protein
MAAIGYKIAGGVRFIEINDPLPVQTGSHRFITYDEYVKAPGDHTHWDDLYDVTKMPTTGDSAGASGAE